ncbi:hypothetical protein SEA_VALENTINIPUFF_26 [Microbacterium phage ValentiniPuff]|uniref:Uncharacterized protein n=1 Tax=Microbacterium phage ValentiniPuff TaxID=2315705 RepID=A0A386KP03_9CAUD|nr:hypothetical protein SEA_VALENTINIPUFF_26 [Microbacterium phage ValentiniPuff]
MTTQHDPDRKLAEIYADATFPESPLAPENEALADVAADAYLAGLLAERGTVEYQYRAVCQNPIYGKVRGVDETLATEWMDEETARIVVADRSEWDAWLERRRRPGTPERIS